MLDFRKKIVFIFLAIYTQDIDCIMWDNLRCAPDSNQDMTEGSVADLARFPWLGVVQHAFYIGGKTRYAVTGAVVIHPGFAIAAAEDIAKIIPDQIVNNTHLIVWGKTSNKFVLDVKDYVLHPQYHERVTFATIALLDLIAWGESPMSEWKAPVLPICMPVRGSGTLEQIYAVKMDDAEGKLQKEIIHMKYVESQACEEFYYKAQLLHARMNPINPLCAVSKFAKTPCVWDAGTVLITRQPWGFWRLLGFAVRGPGCGAPTRFLNMHDYLPWITDIISRLPYEDSENTWKLGVRNLRRQSPNPYELIIYKTGMPIPKNFGVCEKGRKNRGTILFKDSEEILINKNFIQGYYFLVVTQMAEFSCAHIQLEVSRQSNAAVWVEHSCHRFIMGLHLGYDRPSIEREACFMYFKTSAYIEIRFLFSFKAMIDISVYGTDLKITAIPNPFKSTQYTEDWWPTPKRIQMGMWHPMNKNLWWL